MKFVLSMSIRIYLYSHRFEHTYIHVQITLYTCIHKYIHHTNIYDTHTHTHTHANPLTFGQTCDTHRRPHLSGAEAKRYPHASF